MHLLPNFTMYRTKVRYAKGRKNNTAYKSDLSIFNNVWKNKQWSWSLEERIITSGIEVME